MIYFVLIRHGETHWTKQKRYQGTSDTRLNARGRKQIQNFVNEVVRYKPHVIFSSSLERCRESAEILCEALEMKPMIDDRLNELHFGDWEGKTAEELIKEKNKTYGRWIKGKLVTPQGGESVQSLRKRVRAFIGHCVEKYDNKKIIIVTHGGPIRMFFIELLKLSMKTCFQFRVDPGTMTILGVYDYSTQLVLLNSPLPKKGIVPHGCA
jgi:alpha-ribazole phosphatase